MVVTPQLQREGECVIHSLANLRATVDGRAGGDATQSGENREGRIVSGGVGLSDVG